MSASNYIIIKLPTTIKLAAPLCMNANTYYQYRSLLQVAKWVSLDLVQASFPSSSTLELKGVSTTAQSYGAGEQHSLRSSFSPCEIFLILCWRTLYPDSESICEKARCVAVCARIDILLHAMQGLRFSTVVYVCACC